MCIFREYLSSILRSWCFLVFVCLFFRFVLIFVQSDHISESYLSYTETSGCLWIQNMHQFREEVRMGKSLESSFFRGIIFISQNQARKYRLKGPGSCSVLFKIVKIICEKYLWFTPLQCDRVTFGNVISKFIQ